MLVKELRGEDYKPTIVRYLFYLYKAGYIEERGRQYR